MTRTRSIIAGLALALLSSTAAFAGDVRIEWYSDGNEGQVLKDLIDRFGKDNPDIRVTIDEVPYKTINEQLPVDLAAGNGPDIARVTNLKDQSKYWLDLTPYVKDPSFWQKNYGDQADWMRPDGSKAITGFMTQLTLTGGYANKTLFDQAGIALPGPAATWDEWIEAAKKVAAATKVPYAFSIDRSGHRLTGPSLSFGNKFIGDDGKPLPLGQGAKDFISRMVGWAKDGTLEKDVWVSAAGTTYRSALDDFVNGQLVFFYSGSWQVPALATKIGTTFDWVATGSPCGPGTCTGMPGGAGLVAIASTKNPTDVGKVMDYLASTPIAKEFAERTLFLPSNTEVVAGPVDFKSDNPLVKDALSAYVKASGTTAAEANAMNAWKWSQAVFNALVTRTSQAIAGELSVEDTYKRIDEDVAAKVNGG